MNIVVTKKKKTLQSPLQKKFTSLKRKIKKLQNEKQECKEFLDHQLNVYHETITPLVDQMNDVIKELIRALFPYVKPKMKLNKQARKDLKEVITILFTELLNSEKEAILDEDLEEIFQEITGADFKETMEEGFSMLKKQVTEELSNLGVHVDLSNIEMGKTQEEILDKIFEKFTSEGSFPKIPENPKKEEPKELTTIYKQLVKVLHPDLELNLEQKALKEEAMKKLTVAYKEQDLHTLLWLEKEWALKCQDIQQTEDRIKVFNKLLKEQTFTLQSEIEDICRDPRYVVFHGAIEYGWRNLEQMIPMKRATLSRMTALKQRFLIRLSEANPYEAIYELCEFYR